MDPSTPDIPAVPDTFPLTPAGIGEGIGQQALSHNLLGAVPGHLSGGHEAQADARDEKKFPLIIQSNMLTTLR